MCARATMTSTDNMDIWNSRRIETDSFKPLRTAIVGCGRRTYTNALPKTVHYDEYDLRAVCDIRPDLAERAQKRASDLGKEDVRGYTDFDKMLEMEELDAILFLLDPDIQVPMVCKALEAGAHAMCEVPLAFSIEDCWKLVTTVEKTGKIFMIMEQLRYSGYIQAWRNMVEQGVIGKALYAEGQYFHYLPAMHYQDEQGRFYGSEQAKTVKNAKPTWRNLQPPICYLPHELSPILYALDDRVVRVVGMSTQKQSHTTPGLEYPDMQVALMHTEKDVILRMAVDFGSPHEEACTHWHHIKGTKGIVETPRTGNDNYKMWVEGWHLKNALNPEWGTTRMDAPPEAKGSGHGDLDFYVYAYFADAILHNAPLHINVYTAVETAAPAILAAKSMAEGNIPIDVPDFRPGANRKHGEMPKL